MIFKSYRNQDYQTIKSQLLQSGQKFDDREFPATNQSIYRCVRPEYPFQYGGTIVWKRPNEITSDPKFILKNIDPKDLYQGSLGNCWFIAGAACTASNQKYIAVNVPNDQSFDRDYCGLFHFRFWQYGEWLDVVVDDRLPVDSMTEKAYAKLATCYEFLDGGFTQDAIVDLTGGVSEGFDLEAARKSRSQFWKYLLQASKMDSLCGAAIIPKENQISNQREGELSNGLLTGHAYSLTKVIEISSDNKYYDLLNSVASVIENKLKMFPSASGGLRKKPLGKRRPVNKKNPVGSNFNDFNYPGDNSNYDPYNYDYDENDYDDENDYTDNNYSYDDPKYDDDSNKYNYDDPKHDDDNNKYNYDDPKHDDDSNKYNYDDPKYDDDNKNKKDDKNDFDDNNNRDTSDSLKLIRLRNPWGDKHEWNGPYSDSSPVWQNIDENIKKELGLVKEIDGEFWMEYSDFIKNFDLMDIVHVNPSAFSDDFEISSGNKKKWSCKQYDGEWKVYENAGGSGVNDYDQASFWTNPQYLINVRSVDDSEKDGKATLIVSLMHKGYMQIRGDNEGQVGKFPKQFRLYRVIDGSNNSSDKVKFTSSQLQRIGESENYELEREVCKRFRVEPGSYVIIPSTYDKNTPGKFLLRLYTEVRISDNDVSDLVQNVPFEADYNERNSSEMDKLFDAYGCLIPSEDMAQAYPNLIDTNLPVGATSDEESASVNTLDLSRYLDKFSKMRKRTKHVIVKK